MLCALMQLLCWLAWKGFAVVHGLAAITYLLVWYCWFVQVQAQLEQTLDKLQGEQALNQQLSTEVEQV